MHVVAGELVVSPTDLTRFLACRHLTRLDVEVARGLREPPAAPGEELELLFRRGLEHERAYLGRLRAEGRRVVEIGPSGGAGPVALHEAEAATVRAMAGGADVVYQAAFAEGAWRGYADFLLRSDDRPGRWPWSYDVADTKLARRAAVPALLQLAAYAEWLTPRQGIAPERLVVVTGDCVPRPFAYQDVAAAARRLRAAFSAFAADPPPTAPVPVPHCGQCRWRDDCRARWREDDDLLLVAGLRRGQAGLVRRAGVSTVEALAAAEPAALAPVLGAPVADRVVHQARLQVAERRTGRPAHRVLPPAAGRGLALLPPPSPGDVFFDMEGDPYVGDHGLEYLFGLVGRDRYTAYWALEPAAERSAFEALVDHLVRAWDAEPGMHVYHYAPYEPTRLKALAGRYDTRVDEVDRLLRGGRLIDLYAVVRQGVQVGKESYSLKKLEDHYWGHGRDGAPVGDALGSVVAFERWLLDGAADPADPQLEGIRAYNEQDCRSTQALRDWLEGLREEAGGDAAFPRPVPRDGLPSDRVRARAERSAALRAALAAGPEGAATRLLAAVLDWHRREALPVWSDYFRRRAMTDEELLADPVALGGLGGAVAVENVRRSVRWELRFPPQETALAPGDDDWSCPVSGERLGVVVRMDGAAGVLVVDRAAGRGAPGMAAVVPPGPVGAGQLEARLTDLADWVARHGVDAPEPRWRAARDLLLRRPAAGEPRPGEPAGDAVLRLAGAGAPGDLQPGVLAVQGPPGTGKTYVAARVALQALAAGRTVGLCAFSHAAVGTLLAEVLTLARRQGRPVTAVQKAGARQAGEHPDVRRVDRTADVEAALDAGRVRLVAGSAWLFAAPALQERLDLLVVDEAGQLSLANVLAISGSARRLVLFGDPQQLTQPARGSHPPGAGASALGHLLEGRATLSDDRGVLLDETHRMHPEIARFVSDLAYDGRVRVAPGLERQRIESAGPLSGSGLRFVTVPGADSGALGTPRAESPAGGAALVAELVREVLADGHRVDRDGRRHRLRPQDVLVLATHNRQVHRLRLVVPPGVRVGTVDLNQGGQAPLVIYRLEAGGERSGVDFVLDPRRFTVALSRAEALAAVIADPGLLTADVRTPEQLLRVGALNRLAEAAGPVPGVPGTGVTRRGERHPRSSDGGAPGPLPSAHGQLQPPAPARAGRSWVRGEAADRGGGP